MKKTNPPTRFSLAGLDFTLRKNITVNDHDNCGERSILSYENVRSILLGGLAVAEHAAALSALQVERQQARARIKDIEVQIEQQIHAAEMIKLRGQNMFVGNYRPIYYCNDHFRIGCKSLSPLVMRGILRRIDAHKKAAGSRKKTIKSFHPPAKIL